MQYRKFCYEDQRKKIGKKWKWRKNCTKIFNERKKLTLERIVNNGKIWKLHQFRASLNAHLLKRAILNACFSFRSKHKCKVSQKPWISKTTPKIKWERYTKKTATITVAQLKTKQIRWVCVINIIIRLN